MPKNFYNLPPSWNPGYAIPASVMDENLERRAFVTNMTPRGTYDNPKVGNAGYAVPQYVDEEGYGRGTFTTKWLPRGYEGPRVPHWLDEQFSRIVGQASLGKGKGVVMAMQTPMGDSSAPYSSSGKNLGVFGSFGKRAAAAMIANAKRLPPDARASALKAMMDKIDPSLYARAGVQAERARAQGATPQAALAHGIAAAMTEGMLTELHKVGKSRTAPQRRSLLGLGCYGCALGATAADYVSAAREGRAPATGMAVQATSVQSGDDLFEIGPWRMVPTPGTRTTRTAASLSSAERSSLASGIAKSSAALLAVKAMSHSPPQILPSDVVELSTLGLGSGKVPIAFAGAGIPLFKFKHPKTGEADVIYVRSVGTKSEPAIQMWWTKDPGLGTVIWNALVELVAVIVNVVKDAVNLVGDLACGTVTAPGAAAAAAAASGGAAAVGVAIAGGICGGQGGATPPAPEPEPANLTVPLAILGGGALLIIALNKKKKAS